MAESTAVTVSNSLVLALARMGAQTGQRYAATSGRGGATMENLVQSGLWAGGHARVVTSHPCPVCASVSWRRPKTPRFASRTPRAVGMSFECGCARTAGWADGHRGWFAQAPQISWPEHQSRGTECALPAHASQGGAGLSWPSVSRGRVAPRGSCRSVCKAHGERGGGALESHASGEAEGVVAGAWNETSTACGHI